MISGSTIWYLVADGKYFISLCSSVLYFTARLWGSIAWFLHKFKLSKSLPWTINSSPSFLNCFGEHKAIKKHQNLTQLLETIARAPNMLIGLKGNNYYSMVFKRANYKLQNSMFWVVIREHPNLRLVLYNTKRSIFFKKKNWYCFYCLDLRCQQHIVCMKWTSGSDRNVTNSFYPLEFFMLDFSLFPPCILDWLWQRTKAPKLEFFM